MSTLLYTAFGEASLENGETNTDYRYTGHTARSASARGSEEAELGLYFYNARWYDPSLGRFTQPDSLAPNPGNPQDWDRYAYVRNNPVNFNDPTGHCVWDLCIVETTVLVEITALDVLTVGVVVFYSNPEVREVGADLFSNTLETAEYVINQTTESLVAYAKSAVPKPLTHDEQEKVDHLLDDLDGFLDDHPDLASEAEKQANGEELVYDHVKEAKDFARGVEKDVAHLEGVWKNRTEEAQKDIERAVDKANKWLKRINEILEGKNAQ